MFQSNEDPKFRMWQKRLASSAPEINIEGAGENATLSDFAIKQCQERAKANIRAVLSDFGDSVRLEREVINSIVHNGGEAMKAISNQDVGYLNTHPEIMDQLELVVQMDGTRPSFSVRNGKVDLSSSPITDWGDLLNARADKLEAAIRAVGRINFYQTAIGTGFLVAPNLIMTNLHVLEALASYENGVWTIGPNRNINFGYELGVASPGIVSVLKKVTFAGPNTINGILNHQNLDIALIEIEPNDNLPQPLPINLSAYWPVDEMITYIIGYPSVDPGYPFSLMDELFRSQLGYKRLAPGRVQTEYTHGLPSWTFGHDVTTLRGSSGSLVLINGSENVCAGIHYSGTRQPLANWGHILGATLLTPYGQKNLKQILDEYGAQYYN